MSQNVVPLRNREDIRDQAGVWLVRLQEGLSDAQEHELAEWLDENPAHQEALLELAALWDDLAVLGELAELFRLTPKASIRTRLRYLPAFALAASVVAAIIASAWFGLWPGRSDHDAGNASSNYLARLESQYNTAIGEQSTVNLPDGSTILLNTNTRLSVRYTDTERKILLVHGEGHFQVARDPSRPFVVTAGTNSVRAVGTAFSVLLSDARALEVVVTEGTVAVFSSLHPAGNWGSARAPSREATTAVAGDMITIEDSKWQVRRLDEANIAKRLAWHNGMVIFEDERLDSVIDELARYTTTELVLADESLSEIRVAGYFKTGDLDALLFALRENFHIGSRKENANRIVLFHR